MSTLANDAPSDLRLSGVDAGRRWPTSQHTILRKYLDAWLPIFGGGAYASDDVILIDAFAGPGRYASQPAVRVSQAA